MPFKEANALEKFCDMIESIVSQSATKLTKDLSGFIIIRAVKHKSRKGTCLYMKYKASDQTQLGIMVDLVFAFVLKSTDLTLTPSAASFLPNDLQAYAERGMLYRLIGQKSSDTGLIENEIMAGLPPGKKRGFRIAKFMLQNYVHIPIYGMCISHGGPLYQWMHDIQGIDPRCKLYGVKAIVSTYLLRVLFLHLLQHIKGKSEWAMLNDGVLAVCLLDMFNKCANSKEYTLQIMHPFVQSAEFTENICYNSTKSNEFEKLIAYFLEKQPEEFNLMNNKHKLCVVLQMS